jgi:hypothetical protein
VWRRFKDAVIGDNTVPFKDNNNMVTYICLSNDDDPRRQQRPLAPKQPVT